MKRTTISTLAIAGVLTLGLSACSDSTTAEGGKPWPQASATITPPTGPPTGPTPW